MELIKFVIHKIYIKSVANLFYLKFIIRKNINII